MRQAQNPFECPRADFGPTLQVAITAYADWPTEAKILGKDARHVRQKQTTLSIPLEVVSVQMLKRLIRLKKLPQDSEAVRKLVAAGEERVRQRWERRGTPPTQMSLELERDFGSTV